MFKELFTEEVDKKGVTVGPDGATPQEYLKNVYVRSSKHPNTAPGVSGVSNYNSLPFADKNIIVGWFATKHNIAEGYVIQEIDSYSKKEFGKDSFRVFWSKGTTIVKFDLKKGKVFFIDNDHYKETDKVKWQRGMAYHRLFIDNNNPSFKAFNIV